VRLSVSDTEPQSPRDPGQHRGYIDWDRFESNQRRLADNAQAFGGERHSGPPREGTALLHGRVLCGLCGERMGVRYDRAHGRTTPVYICRESMLRRGGKVCQSIAGNVVDTGVGALLIELMTPMTLEVTLGLLTAI
jgi:Recombinase zinc beta ribbon domain